MRPAWSGDEASRFCHGFDSPRSEPRYPGALLRSPGRCCDPGRGCRNPCAGPMPRSPSRSGAPRENFLSPPNFLSGRSPRGRSPSRDGRALNGRSPCGRSPSCESLRRVAYRVASHRHRRATHKASCRRISCRKIARRTGIAAIAARGVRTLFAATMRRAVIPVKPLGTIAGRPVAARTRSVAIIAARRRAFALAGVGLARARIGLLAIGSWEPSDFPA